MFANSFLSHRKGKNSGEHRRYRRNFWGASNPGVPHMFGSRYRPRTINYAVKKLMYIKFSFEPVFFSDFHPIVLRSSPGR